MIILRPRCPNVLPFSLVEVKDWKARKLTALPDNSLRELNPLPVHISPSITDKSRRFFLLFFFYFLFLLYKSWHCIYLIEKVTIKFWRQEDRSYKEKVCVYFLQ